MIGKSAKLLEILNTTKILFQSNKELLQWVNEPKFISIMNLLLNFSSGHKEVLFKRISKTNANSNKKFTYINCQRELVTGKIKIV